MSINVLHGCGSGYDKMGLVAREPVFGVSDKVRFKSVAQVQVLAKKLKFRS